MRLPLNSYTITQGYHANHQAYDLAAPIGTSVYAPVSGVVTRSAYVPTLEGNFIIIKDSKGYGWYTGHHSQRLVSQGQTVKEGQLIARVGATGAATGPHVHFQVRNAQDQLVPQSFYYPLFNPPEEDDMVTRLQMQILWRFYFSAAPTKAEYDKHVGKSKYNDLVQSIKNSKRFTNIVANAKTGTLVPIEHAPSQLRSSYSGPKKLTKGIYTVE